MIDIELSQNLSKWLLKQRGFKRALISVARRYTPTRTSTNWKIKPSPTNYYGVDEREKKVVADWGTRRPGKLGNSWSVKVGVLGIVMTNSAPYAKNVFRGHRLKRGRFMPTINRRILNPQVAPIFAMADDGRRRQKKGKTAIQSIQDRIRHYVKMIIKANKKLISRMLLDIEIKKTTEVTSTSTGATARGKMRGRRRKEIPFVIPTYKPSWKKG